MTVRILLPSVVTLICLILILPIAIVVILAFGDQNFLRFPPAGYSLRWFSAFFGDPNWRAALWTSLEVAAMACVISTVIGFLAAYAFVRKTFLGQVVLLSTMMLPMIIPTVITSVAMYFFSAQFNLIGSKVWLAICHAVIALPVVLLILLSALQSVEPNLERAALSLGASQARMMITVVVPIAAPGIISATLFGFLASFDELIISLFLTTVATQTLTVRIWNSLHLEVEPIIAAVSTFLIAVTALVLLLDAGLRQLRSSRARHGQSH